MNAKAIINEAIIMLLLIVVILICGYLLFYSYIPKTVEDPQASAYKRAVEIEDALEEIEETENDRSILNTYTGETIYTRKYEAGKTNPFDRDPNDLYIKNSNTTATPGGSSGEASSGSTTGGTTSSSGGKLTTTTGK